MVYSGMANEEYGMGSRSISNRVRHYIFFPILLGWQLKQDAKKKEET